MGAVGAVPTCGHWCDLVEVRDGFRSAVSGGLVYGIGSCTAAAQPEIFGDAVVVGAVDWWPDGAVGPGAGSAWRIRAIGVGGVDVVVKRVC